ncbi:MAG: hypothetical protein HQL87_05315 [Magnetococcales bacterium]|nr:hypothetical protein [Magnetococcales bacterium]
MEISNELGLPNFLKSNLLPLELNYYGAAKLVADKLGIQNPPVSHVSWTHGWRQDIVRADQLACDAHIGVIDQPEAKVVIPAHKRRPYLVATRAHETLLRENGFPDTRAVGLPFSYVEPDPTVKRIPGSLLVMPTHVLMRMEGRGRADEIEYLEYIKSISHQFNRVVFCINLGCLSNGLWIDNLDKYGLDYVFGAGMMDQLALLRMRRLFDTFEYMTSNGIGSHYLYAGLCGVKVSLAGPLDHYPLDALKNEPAWQVPAEREKMILSATMFQHSFIKQKFPWLYREPIDGVECVEWAREETGFYNKVSFAELARLFGWIQTPPDAPEPFLDAVFRLDTADNVADFVQFVQSAPYHPAEMLSALMQLLARNRVRSAYILAMLLAKRGQQQASIAFALSVGGLLYNNPIEAASGLQRLPDLVDALPVAQQTTLHQQCVIPVLAPLLATAIEHADQLVQPLLAIVAAAVPQYRIILDLGEADGTAEERHQQMRAQAHRVWQDWQKT